MKRKLLYVLWEDACSMSGGGWHSMEDLENMSPLPIHTIGWLVKETKTYLVLASHLDGGGFTGSGDLCVPKAWIKKKKVVHLK